MKTIAAEAAITVFLFGAGYLTRWAQDGWRGDEQLITAPPSRTCLYCRGIDWTAACTCRKRCTAMVCIAPPGGAA